MLGLACGELEAAAALAGAPLYRRRPEVMGVRLFGALGAWAGGQDLALDLLRRLASPEGGAPREHGARTLFAAREALQYHGRPARRGRRTAAGAAD